MCPVPCSWDALHLPLSAAPRPSSPAGAGPGTSHSPIPPGSVALQACVGQGGPTPRGQSAWSAGLQRAGAAEGGGDAGPSAPSLSLRLSAATMGVDSCGLRPPVRGPPHRWALGTRLDTGLPAEGSDSPGTGSGPKPHHHCHMHPCEVGGPGPGSREGGLEIRAVSQDQMGKPRLHAGVSRQGPTACWVQLGALCSLGCGPGPGGHGHGLDV